MTQRITVAVVMGGVSGEHDVSLNSGAGVLANLNPAKYRGLKVVIGRDGLWSVDDGVAQSMVRALAILEKSAEVVFLALHGPNGEDGTMQGLFHLLGLPFTGSDHYASSLAMNKPRAKDVFAAAGLSVAPQLLVTMRAYRADPDGIQRDVEAKLGYPAVVKATRLGSSVGVGIVRTPEELGPMLERSLEHGREVMVEKFVKGTEVTSPVIDDPGTGEPRALPLIEIRPVVSDWFDYDAKYKQDGAEEICPALISPALTEKCQAIGLRAHLALGCEGMSRTDIIIDDSGECFVIETNTIPGFTRTSLLPQAALEAGVDYAGLVDMLIQEALSRSARNGEPVRAG
jgi:D-alanine-D-alanine ligase